MTTNDPFAASDDAEQPSGDETQQLGGDATARLSGPGYGGSGGVGGSGSSNPSSPYTSAPQPPAGYNFGRTPASTSAASPYGQSGQGGQGADSWSYGQPTNPPSGAGAYQTSYQQPSAQSSGGAGAQPPYQPLTPAAPDSGSRRRGPGWGGVIATSLVTALLASGGAVAAVHYLGDGDDTARSSSAPTAIATGSTTQTVSSTGTAPDWEAVTAAVSNAVVAITVAVNDGTAVGSGVIYDSSGHIITNNHVVAGATQIQVTLADGRIYEAETTGTDPATDLAVIQLKNSPDDLTVAQFGNSDDLVTGENVMAIGNPLGLSSTATTGIISALNRPVVTVQEETDTSNQGGSAMPDPLGGLLGQSQTTTTQVYTNAIQIDAAINPGNSGGPLFDDTGAVIGITSSIATMSSSSDSAGSIGIGFAIPSNLAQKVADQLIESGAATHAYLGVSIGDGGATTSDGVTRAGAEVGDVESGSPADQAGIKAGDVITAIDGKATSQAAALTGFVRQYSAGDEVTLTVIRDGEEIEATATLKERQDS
ncbi:trypsin-like peptidase domain-containing protein [Actinomyces ruminicola]|uniref:Putative serine protease PepD n=1 Tax=Actinomyces ruminicola TaxID=332524 RepID=A0A1G9XGR8_9ACTO|nr:trypsin-like peptidase domain-containing protein [Actinomyces ruminicola]SDM95934.1 putative serine protease PepD [Actinomyces ruminicola]SDN93646.1 putative serine protease PepD [Actinomyces ruminicola]